MFNSVKDLVDVIYPLGPCGDVAVVRFRGEFKTHENNDVFRHTMQTLIELNYADVFVLTVDADGNENRKEWSN